MQRLRLFLQLWLCMIMIKVGQAGRSFSAVVISKIQSFISGPATSKYDAYRRSAMKLVWPVDRLACVRIRDWTVFSLARTIAHCARMSRNILPRGCLSRAPQNLFGGFVDDIIMETQ